MSDEPTASRRSLVTVAADPVQLASLRQAVGRFARRAGADDDVVETFMLAVSELATNVIQHTTSATVTVEFARVEDGWQLDVSDADSVELHGFAGLPDVNQLAGRGLFIVEAVMDRVELIVIDGHQHLRCVKLAA